MKLLFDLFPVILFFAAFKIAEDQPDAAIEVTLKADGAYARLCIADNGPELSDEEIARLGDIGYTTTAGGLGLGIAIVSTSKGIMTGKEAKKLHQGGEVLAYVW